MKRLAFIFCGFCVTSIEALEQNVALPSPESLFKSEPVGFNCINGCLNEYNLVCSNDITFQNICIAVCQGYTDITEGGCGASSAIINGDFFRDPIAASTVAQAANSFEGTTQLLLIPPRAIYRYPDNNFVFIGIVELEDRKPYGYLTTAIATPTDVATISMIETQDQDTGANVGLVSAVRVAPEGDVYILQYDYKTIPKYFRSQPIKVGTSNDKIVEVDVGTWSVIGKDTRVQIINTTVKPFRMVGEFDYSSEGGCTGSVVGSNFVLTAAHCIYDYPKRQFLNVKTFSPGRFNDGQGNGPQNTIEPFGKFLVDSWMVYDEYVKYGSANHDIAMIKVKPINGKSIQATVGSLVMVNPKQGIDEERADIVGYPSDTPSGTMWASGIPCDDWKYSTSGDKSFRIYHKCDTAGGQSGSPMMDIFDATVFGVHTHGDTGNGWNQGTALNSYHLNTLNYWMQTM